MKNVKVLAFALLTLFFFTHCKQDASAVTSATEQALVKNAWAVDYYFNNQDMTSSFTTSKLLFSSTGNVGCQKDGQMIAGTWKRTVDASNNELISLQFNNSDVTLDQLNRSWKLMSRTSTSLQFEETNGTSQILFRLKTQ
jgi:hypothetical protein